MSESDSNNQIINTSAPGGAAGREGDGGGITSQYQTSGSVEFHSAQTYLPMEGCPFPASKQDILSWAQTNQNLPQQTLQLLGQLPDGTYQNPMDVAFNITPSTVGESQLQSA